MLTVWDAHEPPDDIAGLAYAWNGYSNANSLLRYVEEHSDRLRMRYLALVHELGEHKIGGSRVVDHLALGGGLSYWWMTLLVEKNPWRSPSIAQAVRLLALEEIIVLHKPARLRLLTADRGLNAVFAALCRDLGLVYEWRRLPVRRRTNLADAYRRLPQVLLAIVDGARYVRERWAFRRSLPKTWSGRSASLLFCSYFLHLDEAARARGQFRAHQWEDLPETLLRRGYCQTWIQHYIESRSVPDVGTAMELVRQFNGRAGEAELHAFIDSFLTWRVIFRVAIGWLKLVVLSLKLAGIRHAFRPAGSRVSLWPLMRCDWQASMRGPAAVVNLLWIELFDRALSMLPRQADGLYLCENHGWERAFIHAWRKHGHGRLVGVVHATVRFWDLRYFTDSRTLLAAGPNSLPAPDFVALNGKAALDAFLHAGFPETRIRECEALRYGHLHGLEASRRCLRAGAGVVKVLILGDSQRDSTVSMMKLLEQATPLLRGAAALTAKPHPGVAIDPADYPDLRLAVVTGHLRSLLPDFDVAYSANTTSAAVDAYLAGLPVITVLDASQLNFSPLKGKAGATFVSTPMELAQALLQPASPARTREAGEFFYLDPELPRWKSLFPVATPSAAG